MKISIILLFPGPEGANLSQTVLGLMLLTLSLCMLCFCMIFMVKILNSLLGPRVKVRSSTF